MCSFWKYGCWGVRVVAAAQVEGGRGVSSGKGGNNSQSSRAIGNTGKNEGFPFSLFFFGIAVPVGALQARELAMLVLVLSVGLIREITLGEDEEATVPLCREGRRMYAQNSKEQHTERDRVAVLQSVLWWSLLSA